MTANPDKHHALRIIDANLNRAREALRVMEEYARLTLDDADLTAHIKEARHELAHSVSDELSRALLAARDIVGDVGCGVRTETEFERTDVAAVARAAGKRLSEALRTVEEYGKTLDPALAAVVEKVRYRGYEMERRLDRSARARERFGRVRLYVIVTESLCRPQSGSTTQSGSAVDWFATAEAALRGGADALQLREKTLPDRELLDRAKRLAALCRDHDAIFVVNDRADLATLCGADGVHLGQDDLPVSAARRIMPSTGIIGVSAHTIEQVKAAASSAPDYIAVGTMFPSSTKPQVDIRGPTLLVEARACTSLPLVAIGGINEATVPAVLSVVPCTVCVCQAVIGQPNVEQAASGLRSLIDRALSNAPESSRR